MEEIRMMTRNGFRKLTKQKSGYMAFKALLHKKETGRKTLRYGGKLKMADYLCPNMVLSVKEQKAIFSYKKQS